MQIEIKEFKKQRVAVISPQGNMMGGPETISVHDNVKKFIDKGYDKIVIDLSEVLWMNSSGLGTVHGCLTSLKNACPDGDLRLCGIKDKLEVLFKITKFYQLFDKFYDSVDEAVRAFVVEKNLEIQK